MLITDPLLDEDAFQLDFPSPASGEEDIRFNP
jgi:hypothetical protein